MVIPNTFGIRGERTTASYDFIQFASGFGIAGLYLGDTVDVKTMSSSTFYANTVTTESGNMGVQGATLELDDDYDIEIQKPTIIEGTAIINAGIGVSRSGGNNAGYFIFKLRKWDGVTETEIASNTSTQHNNNGTIGYTYLYTATDITVPRTHFKIGDTLRLTVEVWGASASDPAYVAYGHDPVNRTTGWDVSAAVPSKLLLNLPIRIDL